MRISESIKKYVLENGFVSSGEEVVIDLEVEGRHLDLTVDIEDEIKISEIYELVESEDGYLERGREISKDRTLIHSIFSALHILAV